MVCTGCPQLLQVVPTTAAGSYTIRSSSSFLAHPVFAGNLRILLTNSRELQAQPLRATVAISPGPSAATCCYKIGSVVVFAICCKDKSLQGLGCWGRVQPTQKQKILYRHHLSAGIYNDACGICKGGHQGKGCMQPYAKPLCIKANALCSLGTPARTSADGHMQGLHTFPFQPLQ